ncbi:protoporphyrinogen oxidase [Paraburkholderia tropica]|uniref:hypothetical protein n=1 Tax=Paraburkholderia tropica TaxID=92647 RepID=UPI001611475C|nr:hypothetical protein [Paraburkholderia tropica]MBB3002860.1 protoporphyrinogen oxidase [Paraburkholderia tropica]MBB6320458.1 protoporphyrinogen oxidase [Paraburkholderia tropica]
MLKVLKELGRHKTLVFPSPRGKVLSDITLTALPRRARFQVGLSDWYSENGYARDLAERALAHAVANKVEAACHRTDQLEMHHPMMEAWAAHVCGKAD